MQRSLHISLNMESCFTRGIYGNKTGQNLDFSGMFHDHHFLTRLSEMG
jgi:hypothetical protein